MNDEQTSPITPQQPSQVSQVWGAPPADGSRPPWTWKRTVTAVAVAVGIAAAGTVAIVAASGTASATDRGAPAGPGGGPPGSGGGTTGGNSSIAALGNALHGNFTKSDGVDMRLQKGTVTAVSSTSITLRSSDDFRGSYAITSATSTGQGGSGKGNGGGQPSEGEVVTVVARHSGSGYTATRITEAGATRRSGGKPAQSGQRGPGGPGGAPGRQGKGVPGR